MGNPECSGAETALSLLVPLNTWPTNAHSDQKLSDNYDEILQAEAKLEKYLKGKCYSEHYQQLSFNYFLKSFIFPKLLSKVS